MIIMKIAYNFDLPNSIIIYIFYDFQYPAASFFYDFKNCIEGLMLSVPFSNKFAYQTDFVLLRLS